MYTFIVLKNINFLAVEIRVRKFVAFFHITIPGSNIRSLKYIYYELEWNVSYTS